MKKTFAALLLAFGFSLSAVAAEECSSLSINGKSGTTTDTRLRIIRHDCTITATNLGAEHRAPKAIAPNRNESRIMS